MAFTQHIKRYFPIYLLFFLFAGFSVKIENKRHQHLEGNKHAVLAVERSQAIVEGTLSIKKIHTVVEQILFTATFSPSEILNCFPLRAEPSPVLNPQKQDRHLCFFASGLHDPVA